MQLPLYKVYFVPLDRKFATSILFSKNKNQFNELVTFFTPCMLKKIQMLRYETKLIKNKSKKGDFDSLDVKIFHKNENKKKLSLPHKL